MSKLEFNNIELKINSKKEFISFLSELKRDYITNEIEWENTNIESFIDAMESWATDTELISDEPKWSEFAKILFAGSRYE